MNGDTMLTVLPIINIIFIIAVIVFVIYLVSKKKISKNKKLDHMQCEIKELRQEIEDLKKNK